MKSFLTTLGKIRCGARPGTFLVIIFQLPCAFAASEGKLALNPATAFPATGATKVCPDTPLRLTFAKPPTLGARGKIQIFDAATKAVVETIDISTPAEPPVRPGPTLGGSRTDVDSRSPTAFKTIGGFQNFKYYPVIISGNEATIYPINGELGYNKSYYVTIDAGVFKDGADAYAGLTTPEAWHFTTKATAPVPNRAARLIVAADGTGDFCTVQGALDSLPEGNNTPVTLFVRKGTYTEIIAFTERNNVTILGEDRKQTVIAYSNNATFNSGGGNPFAGALPNPSAAPRPNVYRRGVFLAHRVNDLVLANLTVRDTTPQGGSQSEAIIINGTKTARAIVKDVDLYSYQDTLQINGQAYLNNCYIEGDVDFMWGTGPCFFENCTARSLRSGAYYTQIRNPGTNHGYVYVNCTFDGAPGIMGNYLSRIGTGRFPDSEVVLIDCVLGKSVGTVAWQFQGGREGNENNAANVHFWEFNSHRPNGQPIDARLRLAGSRQLTMDADAALIANYRQPTFVLGNEWNPKLAPIFGDAASAAGPVVSAKVGGPVITTQPASQLALLGTRASLVVVATGPAPLHFQWSKNGHPLPGATAPLLSFDRMKWENAASYTVAVSNAAGSMTSKPVTLTAFAPEASPAPVLPTIPSTVFDVTAHGVKGDGTTDNTAAIQATIDAAVAAGGGVVVFPAAAHAYLTGPITLGNNLDLHLDVGATVQALPYSPDDHPAAGSYPLAGAAFANLITATNAHDVALSGGGTITGNGDAWWAAFRANPRMPHRPFLARFNSCKNVLVSGLTFTRSPMFHLAMSATDNLTVFGVTIESPEAPNTDGIDPSGSHQLFQNCVISCGDDNIAVKAGGAFCSDLTVADCEFGLGHGVSVGGQSNRGLDGMVVKNCTFDGTVSGLRLKADATQGGPVQNVTYTNLMMLNVTYPIVFYSYYNQVGGPGAISGKNQTTIEKAQAWNATPPNSLDSQTLPSWKNITVNGLSSTGTKGYSTIWGLPLAGYFFENVKLNNVHIFDGPGMEVFNATNVQMGANTDVGQLITHNALILSRLPANQVVAAGASASLTVVAEGTKAGMTYQWAGSEGPLSDGPLNGGGTVSGSKSATLKLEGIQAGGTGKYTVTVKSALDVYDVATKAIIEAKSPVSVTSTASVTFPTPIPTPPPNKR